MMKEWGDPLFCLLIKQNQKKRPSGRERVERMSPAPKKKGNVAQRVWELSEPLAKELGLSLWDVQFVKEGADWFLRVFIDKEGGVSIDDCVDMTHALSPVLDKEDPISQEYLLEVSSPGLERKLTRPEHFAAYEGRLVRVRLIRPLETGERELTGVLLGVDEDGRMEIQLDEDTSVTLEKKECSSVHSVDEDFEE
jgi:ribosome maturation factor RimP